MAGALPPHEWNTLTKKPVLFIDGHKLTHNKDFERDGQQMAYFYCPFKRKLGCKASAQGVRGEGKIECFILCEIFTTILFQMK